MEQVCNLLLSKICYVWELRQQKDFFPHLCVLRVKVQALLPPSRLFLQERMDLRCLEMAVKTHQMSLHQYVVYFLFLVLELNYYVYVYIVYIYKILD